MPSKPRIRALTSRWLSNKLSSSNNDAQCVSRLIKARLLQPQSYCVFQVRSLPTPSQSSVLQPESLSLLRAHHFLPLFSPRRYSPCFPRSPSSPVTGRAPHNVIQGSSTPRHPSQGLFKAPSHFTTPTTLLYRAGVRHLSNKHLSFCTVCVPLFPVTLRWPTECTFCR